jgi:hypothetical protein
MSNLLRTSVLALTLLAGASSAMAAEQPQLRDYSDQYGGYPQDSTEGLRAFWDSQSRGN